MINAYRVCVDKYDAKSQLEKLGGQIKMDHKQA
jgi:hypothetical protein